MLTRRSLFATALAGAALTAQEFSAPAVPDRLNQGPFDTDQDDGWRTLLTTRPSLDPMRNPGMGLVGYTWEESGPAVAVRGGTETLEHSVEALVSLPFVDVLYIRCDWRDVQTQPGKLDLNPVWKLTLDAARRHGLKVAFRIQLSSPNIQPARLSMPDFVSARVPVVAISDKYREPRYDHPAFQAAFRELNDLLAARFDGDPLIEWVDLMQYGFWGEGHTSNLKNPFPDYVTAERTFKDMTQLQLTTWKRTPLAVNTQPDISNVGNRPVLDMAVRAGCWLRSDSVIVEEPIQIEQLANRPPWLAAILEDGYHRHYKPSEAADVEDAVEHALDLGANYWSLWTEAANLATHTPLLQHARARIGYRVRPSWIWQRKRYGTSELVLAIKNDGVASVPGSLRVSIEDAAGRFRIAGQLDAGHPHAGRVRQCSFILPKELQSSELKITAELDIRGRRRPVRWACGDGSVTVRLKRPDDAGWRKNV